MGEPVDDIEDISLKLATRFHSKAIDSSFTDGEVEQCRRKLLEWYRANRRALPWRGDSFERVMASRATSASIEGKFDDEDEDVREDDDQDRGDNPVSAGATDEVPLDLEKKVYITPPTSAYGTWVSEIMLQQTRVETVIPYWYRWMEKFPDVSTLAASSPDEVNAMWAGLGYYRRAQQLLKGAQQLVSQTPSGTPASLPNTCKGLLEVPGIGPYTAGAISSIAYGQVEPLVDGNVLRVFSRLRMLQCELGSKEMEKVSWAMGARLVDRDFPGDFNQALMELGATVCKPTSPRCGECPVQGICQARALTARHSPLASAVGGSNSNGPTDPATNDAVMDTGPDVKHVQIIDKDPKVVHPSSSAAAGELGEDGLPLAVTFFPIKVPKKKPREVLLSVAVFLDEKEEKFLFVRRPAEGLLQSQWEFPNIVLWEEPSAATERALKKGREKDKDKDKDNDKGKGKSKGKGKGKEKGKDKDAGDCAEIAAAASTKLSVYDRREQVPSDPPAALLAALPASLLASTGCLWLPLPPEGNSASSKGSTAEIKAEAEAEAEMSEEVVRQPLQTTSVVCGEAPPFAFHSAVAESAYRSVEPIVHIFSHQRHTMHVTVVPVELSAPGVASGHESAAQKTTDDLTAPRLSTDAATAASAAWREVRWMSAVAIANEGITSGCKKILTAVQKLLKKKKASDDDNMPTGESSERRAKKVQKKEGASQAGAQTQPKSTVKASKAAASVANQPSISTFFSKRASAA
jgi:A/G-specific adenine glycosylase